MAGFFGNEGHGLAQIMGPLLVDTLVGMGDNREETMASLATATESFHRGFGVETRADSD